MSSRGIARQPPRWKREFESPRSHHTPVTQMADVLVSETRPARAMWVRIPPGVPAPDAMTEGYFAANDHACLSTGFREPFLVAMQRIG